MIHPEKISLLERTHRLVQEYAESVPRSIRTRKPDAVAFSVNEIVHHLADVERLWKERFAKMKNADGVVFEPMNPDAIAKEQAYNAQEMGDALTEWATLRAQTIEMVKAMDDTFASRVAVHPRYGDMTVSRALDVMANHDLQHLEQMKRTVSSVSAIR